MVKKIFIYLVLLFFLLGCNTITGTVKGVARDIKASYIYGRDSVIGTISGTPISDNSSK